MANRKQSFVQALNQAKEEAVVEPSEDSLANFMFYKGVQAHKKSVFNISQKDAYALSLITADYLTVLHEDLVTLKQYSKFCWTLAEPSTEMGQEYFSTLNKTRSLIKKTKNRIYQIERAQKALKRIVRG